MTIFIMVLNTSTGFQEHLYNIYIASSTSICKCCVAYLNKEKQKYINIKCLNKFTHTHTHIKLPFLIAFYLTEINYLFFPLKIRVKYMWNIRYTNHDCAVIKELTNSKPNFHFQSNFNQRNVLQALFFYSNYLSYIDNILLSFNHIYFLFSLQLHS